MPISKLKDNRKKYVSENICKSLHKGACVKIKNSQKTFQVIGINPKNNICWLREWPFALEAKRTFSLELSQITIQTFCSNHFSEKFLS